MLWGRIELGDSTWVDHGCKVCILLQQFLGASLFYQLTPLHHHHPVRVDYGRDPMLLWEVNISVINNPIWWVLKNKTNSGLIDNYNYIDYKWWPWRHQQNIRYRRQDTNCNCEHSPVFKCRLDDVLNDLVGPLINWGRGFIHDKHLAISKESSGQAEQLWVSLRDNCRTLLSKMFLKQFPTHLFLTDTQAATTRRDLSFCWEWIHKLASGLLHQNTQTFNKRHLHGPRKFKKQIFGLLTQLLWKIVNQLVKLGNFEGWPQIFICFQAERIQIESDVTGKYDRILRDYRETLPQIFDRHRRHVQMIQ